MTPALRTLTAARNAHDAATLALWSAQSRLLAALAADSPVDVWQARERCAIELDRVDAWRAAYDAAFDAVASERSAASPVRLVARDLTPAEASALAAADDALTAARLRRDNAADHVAWWMGHRALGDDGLMASQAGEQIALWRAERDAIGEQIALWRAERDAMAAEVDAALAARAPLLAARWQEVAT